MLRLRDHSAVTRFAVVLLTVAFVFALSHSLTPEHHDESHVSECVACLLLHALIFTSVAIVLASRLRSGLLCLQTQSSAPQAVYRLHSGRSPPHRQ